MNRGQVVYISAAVISVLVILGCSGGSRADKSLPVTWSTPSAEPTTDPDLVAPDVQEPDPVVPTEPAADTTPAAPRYATPSARNLSVSIKITEKQCFGSAGCLISFKVKAKRLGGVKYDPDKTYEVTYRVRGVEDGPLIGSFEITGDKYEIDEESVSTASVSSKLTIKITDIEEV